MPSNNLVTFFQDNLKIDAQWEVSGRHYGQTAEDWLKNTDDHREKILSIFAQTYGPKKARQWLAYWRVFFMACAELWNFEKGEQWMVCHYLMSRK
jgi:cyclopropane-fatty-acyl-phospholipid synthase